MASPYLGASGAAQAYSAFPTMSLAPDLAATFQAITTGFQTMIDTVGVGKFNDGTVAAPGLRFEADHDTGLQRPASNTLALIGGGVELLRLATSGASGAAVQSSLADATPGLLALVGGFGLEVETYLAVPDGDIDATTLPTGSYRVVTRIDGAVALAAQAEVCELIRVALDAHKSPVTRILSEAIAMTKAANPGLRLLISYAAPEEGHHGGIYQAGNWIYEGSIKSYTVKVGDELVHGRSMSVRIKALGMTTSEYVKSLGLDALPRVHLKRHKYLMPLDRKMRRQVEVLAKENPKADTEAQA